MEYLCHGAQSTESLLVHPSSVSIQFNEARTVKWCIFVYNFSQRYGEVCNLGFLFEVPYRCNLWHFWKDEATKL